MSERALILFLKNPEKGKVKTRLARDLGDDFVFKLYNHFITDILETCSKVDADTIIALSYDKGALKDTRFYPGFKCFLQTGKDLGERLYNAFNECRELGYEKMVLTGSDIPDLPAGLIQDAFHKLDKCNVVLGPSKDGGYYLIGMSSDNLNPAIFRGVQWSASGVLDETVSVIKEIGLKWDFLIPWLDIDDLNDLKNHYKNNKFKEVKSSTMDFIIKNMDYIFKNK